MASFWGELRRRNLFRVGVAYLAAVWLLLQVADMVLSSFEAPAWILQALIFSSALGFPVALVLAWFYELTPEGIKATSEQETVEAARFSGRKLDIAIIAILILAVGFLVLRPPIQADTSILPNSVAILPFDNLSPDPDDEYFAAGIHEQLLNELARVRDLNVIARTSVLQYADAPTPIPEIARALRVEAVMEGSVRYAGDQVRVTAQLIDGESGAHLWTEDYDGSLADIFAIQTDIATRIAAALEAELSPEERRLIEAVATDSTEAYEYFLRAVTGGATDVRHRFLDLAIALDENFSRAYATKASFYGLSIGGTGYGFVETERAELVRLMRENAEAAIRTGPEQGQAHRVSAYLHSLEGRIADAEAGFELALELSPNSALVWRAFAVHKRRLGEFDAALAALKRAQELDPLNRANQINSARVYWLVRDYDGVVRNLETSLHVANLRIYNALAEIQRGNDAVALEQLERSRPENERQRLQRTPNLAYAYRRLGREDVARELVAQFEPLAEAGRTPPGDRAVVALALGEVDETLRWMEEAAEQRVVGRDEESVLALKYNMFSDPILDRPEFVAVRDRLMVFES